ncbi:hypothetical protein [Leptospira kirschneri]|uniref:hypothetical protein n=1 Tax=Leptospira kirschneri TaxID=29507 RepID=UPI0002D974D3|nr:hypothetical protein [Leptospira kirschneri]KON78861.1 Uncharacterized protein NV38_0000356 [Leptospira kirschneri serovar Mozdok]NDK05646.1 hypothetical protein [Leptospira kirschneri serovar Mozdok]
MKLLSLILKEFEKSFCKNKIKYIHLVFGTSLFFTAWSESTLEYYKMIQDILIKAGVGAK